jgi:hypothetical protein
VMKMRAERQARAWHRTRIAGIPAMLLLSPMSSVAQSVDCAETYGGKPAQCVRITCDARYASFLGVWTGPFHSYVRDLSKNGKSVFRPYDNKTEYALTDCLKNEQAGETFIVGHMTDTYPEFSGLPARVAHSLLITGVSADGNPFMRIVNDQKNVSSYQLEYQNTAASIAVWSLLIPKHDAAPDMLYSTIDALEYGGGIDRRNVTITLRVGPKAQPYFNGVVGYGYHVRETK